MTIFQNASLRQKEGLFDLTVEDGMLTAITPHSATTKEGATLIDLQGNLVCEPCCDPHIHLDYVFTAQSFAKNTTGTLFDGIESWSISKSVLTVDAVKERAKRGLEEQILGGTQYLRTHVDVTDPKLTALHAMLELREEVKDVVEMQIVAFPQEGMYAYPQGESLVEEALKLGADVVGAIPHFEHTREQGEKSVKKAVELAVQYNCRVDVHCDETDDEQSRFLEVLASEGLRSGLLDKVTASHACAMGSYNNAYAFKLMKLLKDSKINIIACPTENIHLQGRYDSYPKRRGLTRVDELLTASVNVCFAQDSISDPWYPLGNGNLMNVLDAGIHICHLMQPEEILRALDLITINGAKTLGLGTEYTLAVGNPANFIVYDGGCEWEVVRNRASVLRSVRKGNTLFVRPSRKPVEQHIFK